jgi:hypothetical protein
LSAERSRSSLLGHQLSASEGAVRTLCSPPRAAQCSGVQPQRSRAARSAPRASRQRTVASPPAVARAAAQCLAERMMRRAR